MIEVFYFFYYQSVAIYMAFLPAYLRGLGLSGREMSTVFASRRCWRWRCRSGGRRWPTAPGATTACCASWSSAPAWGFAPLLFARIGRALILVGWIATPCSTSRSAAWPTRSRWPASAPARSTAGCGCGARSASWSPPCLRRRAVGARRRHGGGADWRSRSRCGWPSCAARRVAGPARRRRNQRAPPRRRRAGAAGEPAPACCCWWRRCTGPA